LRISHNIFAARKTPTTTCAGASGCRYRDFVARGRALATGAREAFGVDEARKQMQAAKPELAVHDRVPRQRSSTVVVTHERAGVGG
jgi:hypothetical protein